MTSSEEPCYHFVKMPSNQPGVESYEFVPHDNYPGIDNERRLSGLYDEILDEIPVNDELEPGDFGDYKFISYK